MPTITLSPVVYNRKAKLYAIAPEAAPTHATREGAEEAYIQAVAPAIAARLARVKAAVPALARRAHAAALLVVAQAVTLTDEPTEAANVRIVARVDSRREGHAPHAIRRKDYGGEYVEIHCECEDAQNCEAIYTPGKGHACAHALAYRWTVANA